MSINFAVKWSDNTDELRRNLALGVAQLDTTKERVDRLAASLSGENVIRSANTWAAALQKVGEAGGALAGIQRLTTAEHDRATAAIDRAIAKYAALGQTAPKALNDIADALHKGTEATGGWTKVLGELGNSWVARIAEGVLLRDAAHEVIDKVKELVLVLPELALKGAAVADVEDAFNRLTSQAGRLGATLMGELRTGTHNTVTDFQLMKTANQDLAAGMNLTDKQFGTLAKGAFALAQATGTDVKSALDTMNDAMLTGRTRSLALLTGKLNLTKAEEDFAKGLMSTAEHLTEEGKLEAAREAILKSVGAATERLGEQTDGLDERVEQASVAWENFKENLGKTIATSKVLEAGMSGLKDIITDSLGPSQGALIDAISRKVDDAAIAVISLARVGVQTGSVLAKEWYAVEKVFGDVAQIVQGNALAFEYLALGVAKTTAAVNLSSEGQKKAAADVERIQNNITSLLVTMKARGDALQDADRRQSSINESTDHYVKILNDLEAKMIAARTASESFVGPLDDVAARQKAAADAAARHASMLQASKEELAKAKRAAEEYATAWENLATLGQSNADTLAGLNPKIREQASFYAGLGATVQDLTKAFPGMTEAQAHALESSAKSANATTAAWTELNTIGVTYQQTIAQIDAGLVEEVSGFLRAGASVELVAKAYTDQLSPAQIKAIDEGVKATQRYALAWQKAENDITALWDKAYGLQVQSNVRGLALEQAKVDTQAKIEYDGWVKRFDAQEINETQLANAGLAISAATEAQKTKNATTWALRRVDELAGIDRQELQLRISMYGSEQDAAQAANLAELEAHRAKLIEEGKLDAEYDARLTQLYKDRSVRIAASFDPLFKAWQGLNVDFRNDWAQTWAQGLDDLDHFGQAFENTLKKSLWDPFKNVLAGMLADFENILLSPLLRALRKVEQAFINWAVSVGLSTAGVDASDSAGASGSGFGGSLLSQGESAATRYGYAAIASHFAATAAPGLVSVGATTASPYIAGTLASSSALPGVATVPTVSSSMSAPASISLGSLAAVGGSGVAGWMLGSYLGSKTESKPLGAAVGAAAGAGAGAAIGAPFAGATFGLSIAAGAIVGAIAGWRAAGHLYEEVKTQQADLMKQLGGMEGEIKNVGDAYALTGHSGEEAQKALHAMWDAKTPEEFAKAVKPVAEALQTLQQNTADLQAATTDATGRISEAWQRVVDLNKKYGSNTKEVTAFIQQQSAVVVQGFSAVVAAQVDAVAGYDNIKKAVIDAQAAVDALVKSGAKGGTLDAAMAALLDAKKTQSEAGTRAAPELGDLGLQAVGAYAASVASGTSKIDAIKAESQALTVLEQEYQDLGLEVTDVGLKALFTQNDLMKASGTLMAGIDGLTKSLVAQDNIGLENADMFAAQQRSGEAMYTRLQAAADATAKANGDLSDQTAAALLPMQDYLHQALIEAEKLHVPLDALTQQMIDQSKDAGIWKDAIKPPPTVQDAIQKLADTVDDLSRALRGLPPIVHVHVDETTTSTTAPQTPEPRITYPDVPGVVYANGAEAPAFASEAFVRSPTLAMVGDVTGGEFVVKPSTVTSWLSSAAKAMLDASMAGVANGGVMSSGVVPIPGGLASYGKFLPSPIATTMLTPNATYEGSKTVVLQEQFTFYVNNQNLDTQGLDEYVEKKFMPRIMTQIEDRRRGFTGRLRRALELPIT